VATVDENGNVKALKVGSTVITARCGNKQATCTVTVTYKQAQINRVPVISAEDVVINVGEDFNPMLNVTAKDYEDGDLTNKVEVIENTVNTTTIGIYKVVYKVTDSRGASVTKEIKVTVKKIVTDEPVENPGDDTNKPGVDTDNSTNTNKPGVGTDNSANINKPGVDTNNSANTSKPSVGTDNSANTNKPGVGTDNSANTNKPGVGTDNSTNTNKPGVGTDNSANTNKPSVDTDNSENTNKPSVDTDNSENTNEQDVYNDNNISDSSSPEKGYTGIFGMIALIVAAVAVVIYAINRKKSK